jgi:hypothetical protein
MSRKMKEECPGPDEGDAENGPPARVEPCCQRHFPQAFSKPAKPAKRRSLRKEMDDAERRERAMQAGMGLGIDAYNDEMGY